MQGTPRAQGQEEVEGAGDTIQAALEVLGGQELVTVPPSPAQEALSLVSSLHT